MTDSHVVTPFVLPPNQPLLPLDLVVDSLRSGIPDAEWMLREIESQDGWFRFPPFISAIITNLRLESYPLLYVSEAAMAGVFLKGFMTTEEIQQFNADAETASLEERGKLIEVIGEMVDDFADGFRLPKTPKEEEEGRQIFLAMSHDEQKEAVKRECQNFCV